MVYEITRNYDQGGIKDTGSESGTKPRSDRRVDLEIEDKNRKA
jgi:hypothetical protein